MHHDQTWLTGTYTTVLMLLHKQAQALRTHAVCCLLGPTISYMYARTHPGLGFLSIYVEDRLPTLGSLMMHNDARTQCVISAKSAGKNFQTHSASI